MVYTTKLTKTLSWSEDFSVETLINLDKFKMLEDNEYKNKENDLGFTYWNQ